MSDPNASPLAVFCYNAGSTLEEVLLLDEDELIELSKNIVGNGVLEHARVIKQWRHCRMAAIVAKEVEEEMAYASLYRMKDVEEPNEEEIEEDLRAEWEKEYYAIYGKEEEIEVETQKSAHVQQQEAVMGDDWQKYLKTQIQEQMSEQLALELERRKEDLREFERRKEDLPELETPRKHPVPRMVSTVGSTVASDDDSQWYDDATFHSEAAKAAVSMVAADMFSVLEQGLSFFTQMASTAEEEIKKELRRKARYS